MGRIHGAIGLERIAIRACDIEKTAIFRYAPGFPEAFRMYD
jgi:hypothetical protein